MERKLLAIEADYDDAVARVRYFEGLVLEREAGTHAEQEQREQLERQLDKARSELGSLRNKLAEAEATRDAARLDAEASAHESAESERRFAEQASELSVAVREAKRHEGIARDLLEELRGLEQRALVAVEHDARVSELEAERERAMQRALEAEVARESAQMRVDELRAQVEQPRLARVEAADDQHFKLLQTQLEQAQRDVRAAGIELTSLRRERDHQQEALHILRQERADEVETLHTLRGERIGLALRLDESEEALRSSRVEASADDRELDTRLGLAEARAQAALSALGEAEQSIKSLRSELDQQSQRPQPQIDPVRIEELESQLSRAEQRVDSLERELEEADRFAEDHAEDAERVETLEVQLESARQKLDTLDDDVRALQDELFASKEQQRERERVLTETQAALAALQGDAGRVASEASTRVELLLRRESELRSERDDAHAALAEARAILSHLAVRVGAETHDLPAIMQALDQHTSQPSLMESLRMALADAQAARSDSEHQMSRMSRQLEESEARVRELEGSLQTPQALPHRFDPPEV